MAQEEPASGKPGGLMVSIPLNKSNPTFVLLFGLPCPALDAAQGLPAALGPLGGKGLQL